MPEELLYHDHIYSHKRKITITLILFISVLLLLLLFLVFTLKTRAAGKSSVSGSRAVEERSLIAAGQTDPGIEGIPLQSVIQESIAPTRTETPILLFRLEES